MGILMAVVASVTLVSSLAAVMDRSLVEEAAACWFICLTTLTAWYLSSAHWLL